MKLIRWGDNLDGEACVMQAFNAFRGKNPESWDSDEVSHCIRTTMIQMNDALNAEPRQRLMELVAHLANTVCSSDLEHTALRAIYQGFSSFRKYIPSESARTQDNAPVAGFCIAVNRGEASMDYGLSVMQKAISIAKGRVEEPMLPVEEAVQMVDERELVCI